MEQSLICYFYTKTMSHITHNFINFIIHIIYYSKNLKIIPQLGKTLPIWKKLD